MKGKNDGGANVRRQAHRSLPYGNVLPILSGKVHRRARRVTGGSENRRRCVGRTGCGLHRTGHQP